MKNQTLIFKGKYQTLEPVLTTENNLVTLGGATEDAENLFIRVADYKDSYYDVSICTKDNEKALGSTGWDIIRSSELSELIQKISATTGITEVKTKVFN